MGDLVVKDNALINASYSLSLVESRLLLLAIMVAREHHHAMEWDFLLGKPIEISAQKYMEMFDVSRQSAYESLQDACKNLFQRQFSYTQETENKGVWNKTSRWVSDIAYLNETATVSFTFAPAVIPLITQLEKHLTSYELQQIANLNSAYAVRLYEVLISWRSTGKTPMIRVDKLRSMIGLGEDEYERMSNFKSRVLDYSIKQINEHTDIKVSYEQHKQGRTITGFTFRFKVKKNKKKIAAEVAKRDADNGDMFTIEGLSDKQLGRIARNPKFKTDYNHLVSPTSPANHSDDAWMYEMLNRFKKDPSQFDKRPIKDYLDY